MDDDSFCGNRGPRIGDEGQPVCMIEDPLHKGPHIPDKSWFSAGIRTWTDHAFCGENNINRHRARELGRWFAHAGRSSAEAGCAEAG